jgi:hypothetical protein
MRAWPQLLLLSMLACAGCDDGAPRYAGLSFDVQSAPPVPVSVESDRIELVAGLAVKVAVDPISAGESDYSGRDLVALRAEDADLLAVYGSEDAREFVLVGLREGDTCLQVKINRQERECIEVRILPSGE